MNGEIKNKINVIDGGFSTQLTKYVGTIDGEPLWTAKFLITNPDAVIQTHYDYLKAGAEILETNTYQASIDGYKKYMNLNETESLNTIKNAVELAKIARKRFLNEKDNENKNIKIAGSVGSYGAFLHDGSEYNGSFSSNVTEEFLIEWHRPRVESLLEAGVDLLAFETIPCSKEAIALDKLLKQFPETKAWLAFSCKDGQHISSGEDFKKIAESIYNLNREQLVAIGINCSNPLYIESLIDGLLCKDIPLIVYSNNGEVYTDYKWRPIVECPPIECFVKTWLDLGVKWLGGCCRIDANDLNKIQKEILKWEKTHL